MDSTDDYRVRSLTFRRTQLAAMKDRRAANQLNNAHDCDSDKENKPAVQQRNITQAATKPAAADGKRHRTAHADDEQHSEQQQHGSNNKKSKPSHVAHNNTSHGISLTHDRHSIAPLSPAPTPSFSAFDALLAEKDAAYSQLLEKYDELRKQKQNATAALVAQYEAQTTQLRTSSQQLTAHWQDKYEQLCRQQQKEAALRRKEAEAAMAVKELALAEKDKQLREKEVRTAELEGSVKVANEKISDYLLLTGTSITAPPASSSRRMVCCMVNASHRQRRIEFVLDSSQSETDGTVQYRPKRIELAGRAYPACLKGNMNFAVDRTPNFTRYLLEVLYKKADGDEEAAQGDETDEKEGRVEQSQLEQRDEQTAAEAEQSASEQDAETETEQAASEPVPA